MLEIIIASIESVQLNVNDTNGDSHKIKLFDFLSTKDARLEVTKDKNMTGSLFKIELVIPCDGYSATIDDNK